MKRLYKLTALVCALLLLVGCGGKDVNFVYYTSAAAKTLDPQLAASSTELSAVKHLFSGLYRINEAGEAVPDKALETKVSANGLVYTFTLEETNSFSDGDELSIPATAADYVFALQRVLTPSTGSPYARNFLCIQGAHEILEQGADPATLGVRALSATQLEITLSTPDEGLLVKLAGSGAMPCNREFFENAGGAYGLSGKTIVGNGPYYLSAWSEAAGLTLRRHAADSGEVTRLRFVPDDAEKTAAERLMEELQDVALITSESESATLTAKGFVRHSFENSTCVLLFNCTGRAFSNASIRQALASSASETAAGFTEISSMLPANGLIPGSITLLGENFRSTAGNALTALAPAQRYANYQLGLTEIGVQKLSGVTVLLPEGEAYQSLYRSVNQGWQRELGAFFSIETLPIDELRSRVSAGNYDIALLPYTVSENDPAALLSGFLTGNAENVTGFSNPAYDRLLGEAFRATGAAQLSRYMEAERLLLKEAPVVPLKFETCDFFLTPSLSGVVVDPFGPVLDLTAAVQK